MLLGPATGSTCGGRVSSDEYEALEALLTRLRAVYEELKQLNGGVAVLHAEAAIAALESHLRRQRVAAG
jgi:hypothetical protein